MDGEVVMMDAEEGIYFSISEGVGAVIWDGLEEPKSLEQLVAIVEDQFEVDSKQCETEVTEFVESLLENKIIFKQD
jgi:hypothetical protein